MVREFLRFNKPLAALTAVIILGGCINIRLSKIAIWQGTEQNQMAWLAIARKALQENPDLERARLNVKSKSFDRDIAFGDYLPSVDASASRFHTKPTAASDKALESQSYEIEASHELFTGFRTTADFLREKRELESARFDYQVTSATVRFQLRSAFIEVILQKRLFDVNQKIAERRRRNAEMINLRYEAGREHQGSQFRAQALSSQADFEMRQTERRIESKSLLLSRHIGGRFMTSYPVEGELEPMINDISDEKPDFAKLAEKVPQVQNLIKLAEAAKAAVVSAQSVVWPQIGGSYSYGYSDARFGDLRDGSSIGVTASVPLFNGGKNIETIQKAQVDYRAAYERAESARNQAISDLSEAWSGLKDAKEQVLVQLKFLEASRKRAEIVSAQYEAGLVDFQDFDIAEQELSNSERQYAQSLSQALTQEANWNLIQGNALEDVIYVKK